MRGIPLSLALMKAKLVLLVMAAALNFVSAQTETKGAAKEEIQKVLDANRKAMNAFMEKARSVPREERQALYESDYPKPGKYADKLKPIIEANPKDPAVLDAVVWIGRNTMGSALEEKHFKLLKDEYLNHEKMGEIVMSLAASRTVEATSFVKFVSEKSTIKEVRGSALYARAYGLKRDKTKAAEHKALVEKIIADHSDLEIRGRNVAKALTAERDAAVKFAIGNPAPEIIGKDVDGKEMKLSDYKGKIVVLDFWGDW